MAPFGHITTRYQITLAVEDQPGVLATIATVFSDNGVSVEAVAQSVGAAEVAMSGAETPQGTATLVIGTHEASEADLAATVAALTSSDVVSAVVSVLRVEGL